VPVAFPWQEGSVIGIDHCIAPAIHDLWWVQGIETRGSCCGHGEEGPSVIIEYAADAGRAHAALRDIDGREWRVLSWILTELPSDQ